VIAVQRHGQTWEVVMSFSLTSKSVDLAAPPSGYPDLMAQSGRGVNQL